MEKEIKEKIPERLRGFGTVVKIGKGLRDHFKPEVMGLRWWRSRAIEIFWFLLLVALNFYQVRLFFGSKFVYSFSAPLIPFLAEITGFPVSTIILIFYILGPLTLYFLVKEVTGRLLPGIIAALIFSSPIFKLRLLAIFFYSDGAHIAGLTLTPLVAYLALRFLRSGSFPLCILASLGITLVALISPFSLFVCSVFLVIITFSEMLLAQARLKLLRLVIILVLAAGFSAFWYNPDFVRLTLLSRQGREAITTLFNLFPISFFIVPILGTLGFLLFIKRPFLQPLFIALGLTIVFFLFTFAGRLSSSFFVSYPDRYLPELSFALSFLAGILITGIFDFLRTAPKIGRFELKSSISGRVAALFLAFVFLTLFILFLGQGPSLETLAVLDGKKVLGAFASEIAGIGEIRSQTGRIARLFGYFITSFTVGAVGYLGISSKLKVQS